MITFEKQENGVLFTFTNSDKYLYGSGTIEVPFNSLSIIQDESDNITLRKSASNDIFLSARYDTDFGYASKEEAVNALKEILYNEAGISEEEVQQMIDAATSGIPSSEVIEQLRTDVNAVSGTVSSHTANTEVHVTQAEKNTWNGKVDEGYVTDYAYSKNQIDGFLENATTLLQTISGEVDTKQDILTAGANITISGNVISAEAGNNIIELTQEEYDALTEKDPDALYIITDAQEINMNDYYTKSEVDASIATKADTSALTAVQDSLSGYVTTTTYESGQYATAQALNALQENKLDASAYTPTDLSQYWTSGQTQNAINAATSGKADTSAVTQSLSAKQDALSAGTGIEISGNVISATGGGGAAYSAGTNISIDTANTINCTLPITAKTNVFDTISVGKGSGGGTYNTLIGPNAICDKNSRYNVFLIAHRSSNSDGGSYVKGSENVIIGSMKYGYLSWNIPSFSTSKSVVIGGGNMSTDKDNSLAIGYNANVSGTTKTNINNQITVDTNNQVYIKDKDNVNEVCIQDAIAALGGLKLVKISQSDYDQLATKDSSTLYIISD